MAQRRVNLMRSVLAGLMFLLISLPALAQANGPVNGVVESIGFNSTYRPDCFTPMVVHFIKPPAESGEYIIEIKQKDQSGDEVTYKRTISITGGESAPDQRFAMYFLPQPINQGLPDFANGGSGSLRDLQKELKVFLCNKSGKQIASLPLTSTITSVDPPRNAFGSHRGAHLVLAVCGNGSAPAVSEFDQATLLGVMEDTIFMQVAARDLPENSVAYDAVDAVVWMNVDPAELKRGGDEKFRALETYVRQGGHLVICQSPQWQQYLEFGDLLPVTLV